jgi:hypothetical protein
MERAIINTNGFFPLDIAYSRVPLEHCDIAVTAVPIAHHESISGKCYATECGRGYSCFPRLRRSSRMFVRAGIDHVSSGSADPTAAYRLQSEGADWRGGREHRERPDEVLN